MYMKFLMALFAGVRVVRVGGPKQQNKTADR